MLRKIVLSAGAAAAVLTSVSFAPVAAAQTRYDSPGYQRDVGSRHAYARRHSYARHCYASRRRDGNKGTVAGALIGGASGALIGGDALGAIVGGGVGAVAGHAIAKGRSRC